MLTVELFESDARGKATSVAVFVNWFSNFIITVTFPFIEAAIGSYSFFIFGFIAVIFAVFILVFVPETHNMPIQKIVERFNEKIIFLF